jgi:hypothetical protein
VHDGSGHDGHQFSRRGFLRTVGLCVVAGAGVSVLSACGGSGAGGAQTAQPAPARSVTLYRQEGCSCCATYADYLEESGFTVRMNTLDDLGPIRDRFGIPEDAAGCHTSVIDDYVVEGHVPVEAIDRLLAERPELDGISVVGMPSNSPGMGEPNGEPLDILSFRDGRVSDFMSVTTF